MKLSGTHYTTYVSTRKPPVNLSPADSALFEHQFSVKINETKVVELQDAHILKGTIFSSRTFKFYPSLSHILEVKQKKLFKKLLLFLLPYKKIDQGVWITDEWSAEYFHWFTDALTRLMVIEEFAGEHTLILPQSFRNKAYIRASLQILKCNVYYYNPKNRLQVNRLYTATHTAETGNYNEQIINKLRDRFVQQNLKTPPTPHRKVFISRQKAANRKITNEDDVANLLKDFGYEIHYFEDYDLKKQIEIMSEAKSLVGLHGAGLTNMLFMPKGGKVLELRNQHDAHNNCFFSLASAVHHDYFYLLNTGNTADTSKVEVTIIIPALKKTLELMEHNAS